MIEVTLSNSEIKKARDQALSIQQDCVRKRQRNLRIDRFQSDLQMHFVGFKGEMAAAKCLGCEANYKLGHDGFIDLKWRGKTVQVKTLKKDYSTKYYYLRSIDQFKAQYGALVSEKTHRVYILHGMISRSRFLQEFKCISLGYNNLFAVPSSILRFPDDVNTPELPPPEELKEFGASPEDMIRYKKRWDSILINDKIRR